MLFRSTGSCPCQDFSTAGKQKGIGASRDLWPDFYRLIAAVRPKFVFGEQVANAIRHGWIDRVCADMGRAGYTGGYLVLGAHSSLAPHIRQRLFWGFVRNDGLSDSSCTTSQRNPGRLFETQAGISGTRKFNGNHLVGPEYGSADVDRIPNANSTEFQHVAPAGQQSLHEPDGGDCGIRNSASDDKLWARQSGEIGSGEVRGSGFGICHSVDQGLQGHAGDVDNGNEPGRIDATQGRSVAASGAWSDYRIAEFRDGRKRRVGRSVQPLVAGVPRDMGRGEPELRRVAQRARSNRTGRLQGYGNAIVPQVAALFIRAFMESVGEFNEE